MMNKKIVLLISLFVMYTNTFSVKLDDLFNSIVIEITENLNQDKTMKEKENFIVNSKTYILDVATSELYSVVEDYFINLKNNENLSENASQKEKINVYNKIMANVLKHYEISNANVELSVDNTKKKAVVNLSGLNNISKYNIQIVKLLISNTVKEILSEEYKVEINIK